MELFKDSHEFIVQGHRKLFLSCKNLQFGLGFLVTKKFVYNFFG